MGQTVGQEQDDMTVGQEQDDMYKYGLYGRQTSKPLIERRRQSSLPRKRATAERAILSRSGTYRRSPYWSPPPDSVCPLSVQASPSSIVNDYNARLLGWLCGPFQELRTGYALLQTPRAITALHTCRPDASKSIHTSYTRPLRL